MAKHGVFHISLARKCQLLFGLAVLLIIAAALFVPGYYMETLVYELNIRRARQLAQLAHARVDAASLNWDQQQTRLDQWWEDNARLLDLPAVKPRLILLPSAYTTVGGERLDAGAAFEVLRGWLEAIPPAWRPFLDPAILWPVATPVCRALPEPANHALAQRGRILVGRMVQALLQLDLDAFQAECVAEMRADETVNEISRAISVSGQPTVYRCLLAVRSVAAAPLRRSLVGLIDVQLPASRTADAVFWTRVSLVLAGMLAGLLAILVFYLISQRLILAPVRQLTALVEQIGGGDLSARADLRTGDEFEDLSDAFNDMLTRLERARTELETINRSLDAKLGELAETNVALFESNRLKSEFLANVSHELRTPLTSIIGFADLLRDSTQSGKPINDARFARYVDNIMTSGRILLDLINDLLDLAKIEAGKVELHQSPFSLHEICQGLADFIRPQVDHKGLTLSVNLSEALPMMNSDAGKLRQVLYNLLTNALKYTPEGGSISVDAVVLDDGRIRIAVADTGPGIAPEDRERIFEKFRQLDASVTREHSGTGLGLAISRELCTMLGGTLRVESEAGKGSRFIVELPVECPDKVYRPMPLMT